MKPKFGIVLGTGLGALVEDIKVETEIDYKDLPGFLISTVQSHAGKLIFGKLNFRCLRNRIRNYYATF